MGNTTDELQRIDKRILKFQILSLPGAVLLGLGLYGLFGGDTLHPLLDDRNIAYGLLAGGVILEAFTTVGFVKLLKERARTARRQA